VYDDEKKLRQGSSDHDNAVAKPARDHTTAI